MLATWCAFSHVSTKGWAQELTYLPGLPGPAVAMESRSRWYITGIADPRRSFPSTNAARIGWVDHDGLLVSLFSWLGTYNGVTTATVAAKTPQLPQPHGYLLGDQKS